MCGARRNLDMEQTCALALGIALIIYSTSFFTSAATRYKAVYIRIVSIQGTPSRLRTMVHNFSNLNSLYMRLAMISRIVRREKSLGT
jgi:hypothetical protein